MKTFIKVYLFLIVIVCTINFGMLRKFGII